MILYRFFIRLYALAVRLASIRNSKARLFVDGRKNWRSKVRDISGDRKVIWVHCASLGEFEQGRPVIENCRAEHPQVFIVLTFFSPSGYEIRKDYDQADLVMYLPLDLRREVNDFLDLVSPDLALFVKYEVWPGYFLACRKKGIPLILFSAIFRSDQRHFKWYGGLFRKGLRSTSAIFVQDEKSFELLKRVGITHAEIGGDTRFDRVWEIARFSKPLEPIRIFKQDAKLVILGSSWEPEEKMLAEFLRNSKSDLKVIVAPHEVTPNRIDEVRKTFGEALLYTKARMSDLESAPVLVVDTIGMLSKLYAEADIAIIGGGFGKGLHNTLEAAVFGVPVLIGPNHQQFKEAVELRESGGAFEFKSASEMADLLDKLLSDDQLLSSTSKISGDYVASRVGATRKIMQKIKSLLN